MPWAIAGSRRDEARNYKKYGETAWVIAVLFLAFKLSAAGDYFRPHFLSLASRSFSHSAQKA